MTLMTLHTMRVGVLEASSAACGAPYLTTATYKQVNSMHPLYWDTAMCRMDLLPGQFHGR